MTKLMTGAILALTLAVATPVLAQGVYVGPNGVGVDTGVRPDYHRDRDYYRDHDRDLRQGRSAYEHRDDRYHDESDD